MLRRVYFPYEPEQGSGLIQHARLLNIPHYREVTDMKRRSLLIGAIAVGFGIAASVTWNPGMAQMDKVKATMAALKAKTDALERRTFN
jgi:hypothetical protein